MKISKKQKQENTEKILDELSQLVEMSGFSKVTMSKLAAASGMSDATIYNYFPNKESLLVGYLEFKVSSAIFKTEKGSHFLASSFSEKIQCLVENLLLEFESQKAMVEEVFSLVFSRPFSGGANDAYAVKRLYVDWVQLQLDQAIEKGDVQVNAFSRFLCELVWDYQIGVTFYWLKDNSELESNTSALNEMAISLMDEMLKTQVMNKFYNIGSFLFREHILSKLFETKFGAGR